MPHHATSRVTSASRRIGKSPRRTAISLIATLIGVALMGCSEAAESVSQKLSLLTLLEKGRECRPSRQGIECDYRLENYFHVSIAGVGTPGAGIHFLLSDARAPIYASVGTQHGCVIVNRLRGQNDAPEWAFISPNNGEIFDSWVDCQNAPRMGAGDAR